MKHRIMVAEAFFDVGVHLVCDLRKNHGQRKVSVPPFLCDLLAQVVVGEG
jgi:hypothetical protein